MNHQYMIYLANNLYLSRSSCIKYNFWSNEFQSQTTTPTTCMNNQYIFQIVHVFFILHVLTKTFELCMSYENEYYIVRNTNILSIITLITFMYYFSIFGSITKLIFLNKHIRFSNIVLFYEQIIN